MRRDLASLIAVGKIGDRESPSSPKEARPVNIGEQRRTIYIEPIEEPESAPVREPSPEVLPEPADPHPEAQPIPSR
jgi:hypothetical protein